MKKKLFGIIFVLILFGCSKVKIDTIYSKEHNFYAKFPAGFNFDEYQKTDFDGNIYIESMWSAVVNGCEYSITVTEWKNKNVEERNRFSNEMYDQIMLTQYGGNIATPYTSNDLPWRKFIIFNEDGFKNSDYTRLSVNYGFQNNKHYTLLIFTTNDFSFDNFLIWKSIHFIGNN